MQKSKKCSALFLALAMVISMVITVPVSASFGDMQGHWATAAVTRWSDAGVILGDGAGSFRPDAPMTRAEFAVALDRVMRFQSKGENPFQDVAAGEWYADAVLKAYNAKVISGTSAVTMSPMAQVTREQTMTLLGRALGIPENAGAISSYSDAAQVSAYAAGFVGGLSAAGYVQGNNGMINPQANITRAEVLTILNNVISVWANQDGQTVEAQNTGITVIAAPNVTVTGSAKDLLLTPGAANGTLTLKGTSVSGDLRFQATGVKLALTDSAKISNLSLMQDTTVTVSKDSKINGLTVRSGKLTLSGTGSIDELYLEAGATVSLSSDTVITKLVNNSGADVSYKGKTIKDGETLSGTGTTGGGGGTTTPGGNTDDDDSGGGISSKTVSTVAELEAAVSGAGSRLNVTITAPLGTVNLNNPNLTNLTINPKSATEGSFTNLTVNLPKASVTNKVAITGNLNIQAVSSTSWKQAAGEITGAVNFTGAGRFVHNTAETAPAITISTVEKVILSGKVETVTSNTGANITLNELTATPTISGAAASVTVDTTKVVSFMGATVGQVTTKQNDTVITMNSSSVSQITAEKKLTINAYQDKKSNIGTVTANGDLSLGVTATTVKVPTGAPTLTVQTGVIISNVELSGAATGVTLVGAERTAIGQVSVATDNGKAAIVADANTTPTTVATTGDITQVTVKDAVGENISTDVKKQAAAPTGLTVTAPTEVGGKGTITGLNKDTMQIKSASDPDSAYKTLTDTTISTSAGTYLVRTAATDGVLPSNPVTVVIPAAIGVTSASIEGKALAGQTLTAKYNADATGTITYKWTMPAVATDATATELGKEKTLLVTPAMVGKTITLTVTNYVGSKDPGTATATIQILADLTKWNAAVVSANDAMRGVVVKEGATAVTDVADGVRFVSQTDATALKNLMQTPAPTATQKEADDATAALTAGIATFNTKVLTGTLPGAEALKTALTTEITKANQLKTAAPALTDGQTADSIAPTAKWASAEAHASFKTAIEAASALKDSTDAGKLSAGITALIAAEGTFAKACQFGTPIDETQLNAAIANAKLNLASVTKSANGEDVLPTAQWVAPANCTTYETAITAANAANAANQAAVTTAIETLATATKTFNDAKTPGTKDIVAPVVSKISVVRVSEGSATVTFTTNEKGSYKYEAKTSTARVVEEYTKIDAAGVVTFVASVEEGNNTFVLMVRDESDNETIHIVKMAVNAAAAQRAPLVDADAVGDNNHNDSLAKNYSVTVDAGATDTTIPVTLKATDVVRHKAGDAGYGYWVGIAVPCIEGAKVLQGWEAPPATFTFVDDKSYDSNFTVGGATFGTVYFNLANLTASKNGWVAVQTGTDEEQKTTVYTITFDTTLATTAPIHNAADLTDALTDTKLTSLVLKDTIGSADSYGVYKVARAVAITGTEGKTVYGSFVVTADGASFGGVTIDNKGNITGKSNPTEDENDAHRNAINVAAKSITVTGCTFNMTNGTATLANGLSIWPSETAVTYTITGNTFNGYDKGDDTYRSIAITIAGGIAKPAITEIEKLSVLADMTLEEELAIINGNTFKECAGDYNREIWTYPTEGAKSTVHTRAVSNGRNLSLNLAAGTAHYYVNGNVTRTDAATIKAGTTLTIKKDATLDMGGTTLTVEEGGTLINNGELINNGSAPKTT